MHAVVHAATPHEQAETHRSRARPRVHSLRAHSNAVLLPRTATTICPASGRVMIAIIGYALPSSGIVYTPAASPGAAASAPTICQSAGTRYGAAPPKAALLQGQYQWLRGEGCMYACVLKVVRNARTRARYAYKVA